MIGIIGGTGLYRLGDWDLTARTVATRYGGVPVQVGERGGQTVAFLARHGFRHETPPHRIDYRANLAALKKLGVDRIVAISSVGTLSDEIPPGTLTLLSDFIDQTDGRPKTFFDEDVVHLDFSRPYCAALGEQLTAAALACDLRLHSEAVYVCTNGPRFETPAEIRMYHSLGADVVGMTNVPEVVLAREAEICYATIAIATNAAAGLSTTTLTHDEVEEMMATRLADLARILGRWLDTVRGDDCDCRHVLDGYREKRKEPGFMIPI